MDEQILSEITQLRKALAHLIGTADLPQQKQFSIDALDRAAEEFKKLSSLSNQWIKQYDLHNYFPDCGDGLGKFIREEFEFSNYYTKGVALFYNRKDIQALANELKARNVDLSTYMELKKGKAHLQNRTENDMLKAKAKGKKKSYKLADGLKDVKISDYNFLDIPLHSTPRFRYKVRHPFRSKVRQHSAGKVTNYSAAKYATSLEEPMLVAV